jgi:hypothetical protein
MPLAATTLGNELKNLTPVKTEAEAIANFATAWEGYFSNATVNAVVVTPGTLTPAINALKGAMVGLSATGAAAAKMQSGITAFWGVVVASAAAIWVTTPPIIAATPSPLLGGISAALSGVFTSNQAGNLSLADAAQAMAAALHPLQLGGVATLSPNIPMPIL